MKYVLTHGKEYYPERQFLCKECRCIFVSNEYEKDEANKTVMDVCPECNATVGINSMNAEALFTDF